MTGPAPHVAPPRHRAAVAVLAGTAAYPVAVWLRPASEPAAWSLLLPILVAVAAYRGAGLTTDPRATGRRAAAVLGAWAMLGVAADPVWRAGLGLTGAGTGTLVDAVTLVVGASSAGARPVGRWLAARMDEATSATLGAGEVAVPLGVGLVGGGCLVLASAGLAFLDPGSPGWEAGAVAAATGAYAAVAFAQLQRLRREGLHEAWRRSDRATQPAVAANWAVGVVLVLGGAAAIVSLWWLPPAEPVRRAAEDTPRAVAAWLRDLMDPQTDDDPGEFLEWAERDPILAGGGDVSRTLVLVLAAAVLLVAVAALLATARRSGHPLTAGRVLANLRRWVVLLGTVLAAMFRRRGPPRAATSDARAGTDGRRDVRGAGSRRWRRPSNPRAQVRHDYYRVLDVAGRRGLGRDPSQSPLEYADVLRAGVPDHADAVDDLTRWFLRARYSHHPIDPEVAAATRAASRRLRATLRARGA